MSRSQARIARRSRHEQDGESIAWAEGVRQLVLGATTLEIDIPIPDTSVENLFLDVRLLGLDVMGVAGRVTAEVR